MNILTGRAPGWITVTAEDGDLAVSFYDSMGMYLAAEVIPKGQTREIKLWGAYFVLGLATAISADPLEILP